MVRTRRCGHSLRWAFLLPRLEAILPHYVDVGRPQEWDAVVKGDFNMVNRNENLDTESFDYAARHEATAVKPDVKRPKTGFRPTLKMWLYFAGVVVVYASGLIYVYPEPDGVGRRDAWESKARCGSRSRRRCFFHISGPQWRWGRPRYRLESCN